MTTDSPDVLIVTTSLDDASDSVVDALRRQGSTSFYRLNTEDLPLLARGSSEFGSGHIRYRWDVGGTSVSLSAIKRVWFRRHRLPTLPTDTLPAHEEYCLRESLWFLRGLLFSLGDSLTPQDWMSDPANIQRAESKIFQLTVASRLGLRCPSTLISNDPHRIQSFFDQHRGQVVAKALRMGYFDYGEEQRATYTTKLSANDLSDANALSAAPVIYQQYLQKRCDIRVTIVGNKLYAAAIYSQGVDSARVDWRQTTVELPHEVHQLPSDVEAACFLLMSSIGLAFGAIDLVLTPEGDYVFLEVNPSGQWLWLEDKLGFPIADDIARWLLRPVNR